MSRALRLALGLPLLLLLLSGCAALQTRLERPVISLVDLDLAQLSLFEQRFLLTLNVQNPNGVAIPVKGMSYTLQLDGKDFAHGVSANSFTVPAYGESRVQVELSTNMLSALRQFQALLEGSSNEISYRLAGKLDVDAMGLGASVPFENAGQFKLTQ